MGCAPNSTAFCKCSKGQARIALKHVLDWTWEGITSPGSSVAGFTQRCPADTTALADPLREPAHCCLPCSGCAQCLLSRKLAFKSALCSCARTLEYTVTWLMHACLTCSRLCTLPAWSLKLHCCCCSGCLWSRRSIACILNYV